jgi:cell division initiation protein
MSPDEIVNHRFKQALRGYAIDDVDDLLDKLAEQVERTQAELAELRERVRDAEASAAAAEEIGATLQRTLVVAQQAADRTVADAEEAARTTRERATAEAARIRADAEAHAARTFDEVQTAARREVDAARARVDEAASRYRQLLADVAAHRDELHARLRGLDEIVTELPTAEFATELVAGELDPPTDVEEEVSDVDDATSERTVGHGWASDDGPDTAASPGDGGPLTVRVHDPAPGGGAPLGSEPRRGS